MDSINKHQVDTQTWWTHTCTAVLIAWLCSLATPLANAQGQTEIVLLFHNTPNVKGSLIRFGDLLEVRGDTDAAKRISELPLVPTPQPGAELRVSKEDILQQLQLRGFDLSQFRWLGDGETVIKQIANTSPNNLQETANLLPAFSTDRNFIQAERNLKDVITRYLALQNPNLSGAAVQFEIPKDKIHLFFQRRNIKRIGGGVEPWTGEQTLTVQILDKTEVIELSLKTFITPPETFVVANRPIRKGDIIEVEDLRLQSLPANSTTSTDVVYFNEFKDVLGKQLRRSISTGQAIREEDVGPPVVVEKNQLVQIKVIMGGIEVETAGRAITEGAVGDLVQVETINLKERKKLTAQVLDTNSVQVIAAGVSTARR